jgi:hypothetical protein
MKVSDLNKIIEETISNEIKNTILNEGKGSKTAYCVKCEGEYVEICDTKEEADSKCEEYNKNNPDKKFVVEEETYESKEELIDKLDQLGEELDSENMEENQSVDEKLHGGQHKLDVDNDGKIEASDLAKLRKGETNESTCEKCGKELCECGDMQEDEGKGEIEMDIDETTCEKCGKGICECGDMNETETISENKKVIRMTESELVEMITKMVNEAIPGLKAVEDSHKVGGKETKEHMGNVDKKIKDALSVEGNDNPEFPKAVGKGGPETLDPKKVVHNTDDQNEEMEMERGENPLDLDYDHEPTDEFKDRLKKALEGDSTMGNADGGNTIPTDTGKNIAKTAEKRKKRDEEKPMYVKDVQPVKIVKESKEDLTETVEEKKSVLEEEIQKMKKLSSYNEKTQ